MSTPGMCWRFFPTWLHQALRLGLVLVGAVGLLPPVMAQPPVEATGRLAAEGEQLIVKAGCAACHRIADPAFRELRRRGPDLRRVASKLDPGWTVKWLSGPREFRPTTWMPHFFDVSDPRDVHQVVSYLWSNSEQVEYPEPPPGDAVRGAALFETRGCTACHLQDAEAKRGDHAAAPYRLQGPNLIKLGSKVTAGWLYAWLKDPTRYAPETLMPNLRLNDQEAADLTAHLLTSRDERYEELSFSNWVDRDVKLGEYYIETRRCFGCHLIPGFEDRLPDAGPIDGPVDFTDHEIRSGWPVQGFVEDESSRIRARLAALNSTWKGGEETLGAGRRLVAMRNCRGCHLVEGEGRAIAEPFAAADEGLGLEPGSLPPSLQGEGARVQEGWLRDFLRDPTQVRMRPWLTVEMPTFGFAADELDTLTRYFNALEDHRFAEQPPGELDAVNLAVGREAFGILQCARCHPAGAEAAAKLGIPLSNLAPSLELSRQRLRYGWIASWILEPQDWQEGTRMPSTFAPGSDGKPTSPYGAALDAPAFAEVKARLLEHVGSEDALRALLGDAEALSSALADHVWGLGE